MLISKCPTVLKAFDKAYPIITNARHWINISVAIEKDISKDIYIKCLCSSLKTEDIYNEETIYKERLLERLIWFLRCGDVEERKGSNVIRERLYDFEKDAGLIFSAFYRTYRIDIEKKLDTMHWWKFMSMFNDLDENTKFVGVYLHYRSLDVATNKEYLKASNEARRRILDIKNRVKLKDDNLIEEFNEESPLDKLRREARAKD